MSDQKLIHAFTPPSSLYPPYLNVSRLDDGSVKVIVRSAPATRKGAYICGYERDKGQPGRCTPGDERCNNYCNMAPQKGPMKDAPAPCERVTEGTTATMVLSEADWRSLAWKVFAEANDHERAAGRPSAVVAE